MFLHRFNAQTGDPQFMCLWESFCLLIAARLWLSRLPLGTVARVRADNLAALHTLRKGSAKSADLNVIAREIAYDVALGCYEWTLLAHIHTKLNTVADALSRLHDPSPPVCRSTTFRERHAFPLKLTIPFGESPDILIRFLEVQKQAAVTRSRSRPGFYCSVRPRLAQPQRNP